MNAMFGKQNESMSSSERTKKIKNRHLFQTVTDNKNIKVKNGIIKNVKSYDEFMSTLNGYYSCKDISSAESCFDIYLNDETDNVDIRTINDFYLTKINYTDLPSDLSKNIVDGKMWPYIDQHCKKYIFREYTYFDEENNESVDLVSRNVKYKFPSTRINNS